MGEMNTTPLIDVLLVLIIMIIITIPMATHSLEMPLATGKGKYPVEQANTVSISAQDELLWNGQPLSQQELINQLVTATSQAEEPLLRFEPDALASYDRSAKTIALIKDAGVTKFAFVGNHKYRDFER
ncbi:ExbD/TolR family protein [Qipengyuania sp. DGS5-3]|uniref:ExbD/TolR family protein n=1 Tax=Qipengyuania sp. DGS5-3 TaxID=3349632 RepID=UPI0036D4370D